MGFGADFHPVGDGIAVFREEVEGDVVSTFHFLPYGSYGEDDGASLEFGYLLKQVAEAADVGEVDAAAALGTYGAVLENPLTAF